VKSIGNFFKKVGAFISKYFKISWNYVKENAWLQPIIIVALIFGLVFGFQGIVNGVEKIKANIENKDEAKDKFTKLTMAEAREKIKNGDDFALFIGAHDCVYCNDFKTVVNKYIDSTGNMIYYIDIHDTSDSTIDNKYLVEWTEMLGEIATRDFDGTNLSTPTVVVIRDGEFADAKSGAQGLSGGTDYLNFVKFVEGEYIDKIESTSTASAE
jgi:predicted bacteriocin transport accessory protein